MVRPWLDLRSPDGRGPARRLSVSRPRLFFFLLGLLENDILGPVGTRFAVAFEVSALPEGGRGLEAEPLGAVGDLMSG